MRATVRSTLAAVRLGFSPDGGSKEGGRAAGRGRHTLTLRTHATVAHTLRIDTWDEGSFFINRALTQPYIHHL